MENKLRQAPHLGWAKLEGQEQFHFYTRHRKNVCRGHLVPRGANPYFLTRVDPGQPVCPGCINQVGKINE
jgi:hypothetical protein